MIRCRFVAEVCSNHNRDLGRALDFVDAAASAGCGAVKFQQFEIDRLFAPEAIARDAKLALRRGWELPPSFHERLAERARRRGIQFASTPFHLGAIEDLRPWVDFYKISSYQVLWLDFLRAVAATEKPVVLATGMATIAEVRAAVGALRGGGCRDLTLLHCVSSYPTRPEESNLAAIQALREEFGVPVGWSDHTADPTVLLRAVRRFGAEMVEFHMDLDRQGVEYGFGHCWLPAEITSVVRSARRPAPVAAASPLDGPKHKRPQPSELEERGWRTDPSDGLRPTLAVRASLGQAKSA